MMRDLPESLLQTSLPDHAVLVARIEPCRTRPGAPFPANLGLGFFLRGDGIHPTPFGTLASPRTFGGWGAGSTVFWIDPMRDMTYAFMSSGLMEESYSCERHQRLSDLVHAALVNPPA